MGKVSKRIRIAVIAVVAMALAIAVGELLVRLTFPPFAFLDSKKDCYWVKRALVKRSEGRSKRQGSTVTVQGLGWRMKPHLREDGHTTNSRGLRGSKEYDYERGSKKRIVVLGDSFTYGLGVKEHEVYTSLLEGLLKATEVVNLGVNGYGVDQQYLFWRKEGTRYNPDLVIAAVYVPDVHRSMLTVREFPKPRFRLLNGQLQLENSPTPSIDEVIATHGKCGRWLRLADVVSCIIRRATSEPTSTFKPKAELNRAILEALVRSVRAQNAKIVFVVIADKNHRDYADHERIEKLLEETAMHQNVPVLNLTSVFDAARSAAPGKSFYASNDHWSAAGHALAASSVAEFLRKL